jgi:stage II sporulation protein GA (sporulation sigma-E factor processing peptidase)
MINFTVDILAIFIAARMVHARISIKRLVLSGVTGAIFATAELFIKYVIVHLLSAIFFLLLLLRISCKNISTIRKVKFLLSFYIAAFLISGAVGFIYGILDRYIDELAFDTTDPTNRKAIIFSLIILLIIGALRLFIMMFSESLNEKSTQIRMELNDKLLEVEALIDTGNLVKDPMNMNPVIFLKKSKAEIIIPQSVIELTNIDELSRDYRKRIRLIPVTRNNVTHVMTGIRMDKVLIIKENYKEEINATIVIDKEEGTFGGYYALAPYVAICNHA